MKTNNYKPHIFSLFGLFVCGNAVITLPFYNAKNQIFVFLITAALSVLFVRIFTVIMRCCKKSKVVFWTVCLPVCLLALYGAMTTLYDYLHFVRAVQLPQTSFVWLAFFMLTLVVVFAISPNSAIYKYCLLMAVFCAAMVILLFIVGTKHFDLSQLGLILNLCNLWAATPTIFLRYFSSLAVPVLFVFLTDADKTIKAITFGSVFGFWAVGICLAQGVLTLGGAEYSYPYIDAVSVISSGSLFTRLDGFVYFIFFATAITKAAVCAKTVVLIIKSLFAIKKNRMIFYA